MFVRFVVIFLLLCSFVPRTSIACKRATVNDEGEIFLYWPVRSLVYNIDINGSEDVPIGELVAAVKTAFRQWDSLACTDLNINFEGLISVTSTNLTQPEDTPPDRINAVYWHDNAWPPPGGEGKVSRSIVALTTLVFDSRTGQIIDADVDVNGADYIWTVAKSTTLSREFTDVANVLTHEAGHYVGLAHSDEPRRRCGP